MTPNPATIQVAGNSVPELNQALLLLQAKLVKIQDENDIDISMMRRKIYELEAKVQEMASANTRRTR